MKTRTKAALGAAATGAALAAYYFYGSENAAKHRKEAKQWTNKAEREIVQAARKVKDKALTDRNIRAIITEAAHRYRATKNLDPKEVRDFIAGMQERWRTVREAFAENQKGAARGKKAGKRQRRPRSTASRAKKSSS